MRERRVSWKSSGSMRFFCFNRNASGADPGVAALWRRAGAAMVVVPEDPSDPMAAVVGDLQAASHGPMLRS